MAAIYYYIDQKVGAWYDEEAEEVFSTWKDSQSNVGAPEDLK